MAAIAVWTFSQFGFDRVADKATGSETGEANKGPARARANLDSYVSNDDYPDAAIRAAEQGTVAFALIVGPDGRVTRCSIVQSSGHDSLDQATCTIMQGRARFEPARDSEGRPVADTVSSRIRWVLPEG